jgi:hypothetical protein
MNYFWLNQRSEDSRAYRDKEGKVYHYRDAVAGSRKLSQGDWFIYYMPGEYVLFGAGRIGTIETEEGLGQTNYYASVEHYRPFDPQLSARDIKDDISFLRGRTGLSGVPQNSIYEIDRDDYLTILRAAGEEDLILDEA